MSEPLLEIKNLVTGFETESGLLKAVDGVSFTVPKGSCVGIVGESGCGKSVTAMSIVRLLPQPMGKILDGEILFQGRDLVQAKETDMHGIRGRHIGVIFQEPMTALNPVHSIGRQIGESLMLHRGLNAREARDAAIQLLQRVRIPAPEQRVDEFPHQLSGGMRQRVVIAIALACHPELIIADEPTTALDVTVQAQILSLLNDALCFSADYFAVNDLRMTTYRLHAHQLRPSRNCLGICRICIGFKFMRHTLTNVVQCIYTSCQFFIRQL